MHREPQHTAFATAAAVAIVAGSATPHASVALIVILVKNLRQNADYFSLYDDRKPLAASATVEVANASIPARTARFALPLRHFLTPCIFLNFCKNIIPALA